MHDTYYDVEDSERTKEIDKLTQSEREEIRAEDQSYIWLHEEYEEQMRKRFKTMYAVLSEIVRFIDPTYVKANLRERLAYIAVGNNAQTADPVIDIEWAIQPNYGYGNTLGTFEYEPGFLVEETSYCRDYEFDLCDRTLTFMTVSEVAEYLLPKITEKVAYYQNLEGRN